MEKIFIKNRSGKNLCVIVDQPISPIGLAFVAHGLGGSKDQPHIETFARAFLEHEYITIRFDVRNTFGESEGSYEEASVTSYYEDLEDVIAWAATQPWYQEPFILAGHSLGGLTTLLYSEQHPEKVKAIAPISTVISGNVTFESPKYKSIMPEWERTGWMESESSSAPGRIKRLKYAFVEDALKYDVLPNASKLTMPVLLMVGDQDTSTPVPTQETLLQALPGKKELHLVAGAPHTFVEAQHLNEISAILSNWAEGLA